MGFYDSSYEAPQRDPTHEDEVARGGSEDELEGSRFGVLREMLEELDLMIGQEAIKKLVKKLAKKTKEADSNVREYALEWLDEVESFIGVRKPKAEAVDMTTREASEMEFADKLERFKVKTLNVVVDGKDQGKK